MEYLSKQDVTVTAIWPSGALECSAIIGGYWCHRRYLGYTKAEAVRLFLAEMLKQ